ncbi:MAG: hypothetical protein ACLR8W_04860 [Segatella copri]
MNIDDAVYYYRTDNENSYNHNISEKNLLSYFKSTRRLIDFFEQNDKKHQYLRATEIGIVNAYRWAANAQVAFEKVDQALGYKPKSCLIRLIIKLIKKGGTCQEGESYLPRLQKAIHSSNICTFSSFMIQK